ncbi:MAG TPA: amidohydrolase family protein [Steroidobacteraceae bacterium]|nr:amidohydrolase family protein [Steroidobacteraceae bacterium]
MSMRHLRSRLSMLFALAAFAASAVAAPPIAITGGTLIDGNGGPPLANATILVREDRIVAVGPSGSVDIPADAIRHDAAGKYVLPGFIDAHVHLVYPRDANRPSDSLSTLRGLHFMEQFVDSGVTSARDVGGMIEPMQALAQAQRLGYIRSLRLHAVGQLITTTGGHGPSWSYFASGPYGFREAVRKMYEAGFHYIKVSPPFTQEEVDAAVDEAKVHRMRITSHGGGFSDTEPESMTRRAVLANVQCIEHLYMPVEDLDLMAKRGIHAVPTLEVMRLLYNYPTVLPTIQYLEHKRGWSMALHERLFREAHKRRIVMGVGTDAILELAEKNYPGMYFAEMEHFVRLGMTRSEAITAATRNGALILGREDELGTLEKGKLADLQIVDGDPLQSFQPLGRPSLVMIGGEVLRGKTNLR